MRCDVRFELVKMTGQNVALMELTRVMYRIKIVAQYYVHIISNKECLIRVHKVKL